MNLEEFQKLEIGTILEYIKENIILSIEVKISKNRTIIVVDRFDNSQYAFDNVGKIINYEHYESHREALKVADRDTRKLFRIIKRGK